MDKTFFAKTDPPYRLERHSKDVAKRTKKFFEQYSNNVFESFEIHSENIKKVAYLCGLLHDIGKANPEWQKWAHNQINTDPSISTSNEYNLIETEDSKDIYKPDHSAVSAIISNSILEADKYDDISRDSKCAIFLAILHHHTDWTAQNMKFNTQINGKGGHVARTVDVIPTDVFGKSVMSVKKMMNGSKYIRDHAENDDSKKWNKIRRTALLLYAGLRQSDWKESGIAKGQDPSFPETLELEDIDDFESLRGFQKAIKSNSKSECLMGLAGCGEGKTYSALLWAKKQRSIGNLNRIIFAMPTQVTTNNLYLNMESNTVSEEKISLYHGATNYIKDLYSDRDKLPDIDKAELYQSAVNVTTVDHIIDTFVSNYSKSPISFANILSSGIVFDEIQAYDEHTTENILACISQCRSLGIPVYVMSATIPKKVREQIPSNNTITSCGNMDGIKREPYEIRTKDGKLESSSVVNMIDNTQDKVMVVKNTVREAQKIARDLRDEGFDVFYYSSEFSQSDRRRKESEIKQKFASGNKYSTPIILVCTQICEISLDLSSDLLLTDIAPIDSIFQRCGRLHRKGKSPNADECNCPDCYNKDKSYQAIVYDNTNTADSIYPYAVDNCSESFQLLSDTGEQLSEFGVYNFEKSVDTTDKVYQNYPTDYETDRYEINAEYGSQYFKNRSKRYEIRDIKTHRTQVLVGNAYSEIQDELDIESSNSTNINVRPSELLKYYKLNSVPIPTYWIHSSDIDMDRINIKSGNLTIPLYTNLNYNYEEGVIPPKEIMEPTVDEDQSIL